MKKVKIKEGFNPFLAVIDGTHKHEINEVEKIITDSEAEFIINRWGALVEISDATLDEVVEEIQATSPDQEVEPVEDVKPKRAKK